jgi:hypothetical protein
MTSPSSTRWPDGTGIRIGLLGIPSTHVSRMRYRIDAKPHSLEWCLKAQTTLDKNIMVKIVTRAKTTSFDHDAEGDAVGRRDMSV